MVSRLKMSPGNSSDNSANSMPEERRRSLAGNSMAEMIACSDNLGTRTILATLCIRVLEPEP